MKSVSYVNEYEEFDRIAIDVSNSNHGDFLKTFATAWQLADPENKSILLQAWADLIGKYSLHKEYECAPERQGVRT